jgi:hypothetical protein
MSIFVKFGHIGGALSDPILCPSRGFAAVLASNLVFVHGGFSSEASNMNQWMLNNRTTRISWETDDKSYFVEVKST